MFNFFKTEKTPTPILEENPNNDEIHQVDLIKDVIGDNKMSSTLRMMMISIRMKLKNIQINPQIKIGNETYYVTNYRLDRGDDSAMNANETTTVNSSNPLRLMVIGNGNQGNPQLSLDGILYSDLQEDQRNSLKLWVETLFNYTIKLQSGGKRRKSQRGKKRKFRKNKSRRII